ncbi:uncharacterized protein LOC110875832 [Helianthus annuus]|uniref:uncharacterized protein LOC110875832 n=1 Tax=Helianthus annuus TaxID=4232 RepID=UPI000B8FBD4E|nr:uncharacterized protein LOC110875832 [Helianthus annuus]
MVESMFEICDCPANSRVKFATATLEGNVLSWWNVQIQMLGLADANATSWNEFKDLIRDYVSLSVSKILRSAPTPLNTKRVVELANGRNIEATHIVNDCKLVLSDQTFPIDLYPIVLGSFDGLIEMDWRKEWCCHRHHSFLKAQKRLRKGHTAILALVTDTQPKERKIEDIHIVHDYPEVFSNELPGLPPHCQVEFQIELTSGATPIARAPYRLAPAELEELSTQLHELLDKGFIRPSSSP